MSAYADDIQLYDSNEDPVRLEARLQKDLRNADEWFANKGMIANARMYQAMVLGSTAHIFKLTANDFSIPVYDRIDLLEMTIDRDLMFHTYISRICSKVSNQVSVLSRFKNLVPMDTRRKLYKAFICSYFRYCSSMWHFCRASDREKT